MVWAARRRGLMDARVLLQSRYSHSCWRARGADGWIDGPTDRPDPTRPDRGGRVAEPTGRLIDRPADGHVRARTTHGPGHVWGLRSIVASIDTHLSASLDVRTVMGVNLCVKVRAVSWLVGRHPHLKCVRTRV